MIRVCQGICSDDERINAEQTCARLYPCMYCMTVASGTCIPLSYREHTLLARQTASMPSLTTLEQAWERVDWYRHRWLVQDYHQCRSIGCRIERGVSGFSNLLQYKGTAPFPQ